MFHLCKVIQNGKLFLKVFRKSFPFWITCCDRKDNAISKNKHYYLIKKILF